MQHFLDLNKKQREKFTFLFSNLFHKLNNQKRCCNTNNRIGELEILMKNDEHTNYHSS